MTAIISIVCTFLILLGLALCKAAGKPEPPIPEDYNGSKEMEALLGTYGIKSAPASDDATALRAATSQSPVISCK
jgi:hypothetical protein